MREVAVGAGSAIDGFVRAESGPLPCSTWGLRFKAVCQVFLSFVLAGVVTLDWPDLPAEPQALHAASSVQVVAGANWTLLRCADEKAYCRDD